MAAKLSISIHYDFKEYGKCIQVKAKSTNTKYFKWLCSFLSRVYKSKNFLMIKRL